MLLYLFVLEAALVYTMKKMALSNMFKFTNPSCNKRHHNELTSLFKYTITSQPYTNDL